MLSPSWSLSFLFRLGLRERLRDLSLVLSLRLSSSRGIVTADRYVGTETKCKVQTNGRGFAQRTREEVGGALCVVDTRWSSAWCRVHTYLQCSMDGERRHLLSASSTGSGVSLQEPRSARDEPQLYSPLTTRASETDTTAVLAPELPGRAATGDEEEDVVSLRSRGSSVSTTTDDQAALLRKNLQESTPPQSRRTKSANGRRVLPLGEGAPGPMLVALVRVYASFYPRYRIYTLYRHTLIDLLIISLLHVHESAKLTADSSSRKSEYSTRTSRQHKRSPNGS